MQSLEKQTLIIHQEDRERRGNYITPGDASISYIAMTIGRFARRYYETLSETDRYYLNNFLEQHEFVVIDEFIKNYPLPAPKGSGAIWDNSTKCYQITKAKCDALINFINSYAFCIILPNNLCKDLSGGILVVQQITVESCEEKISALVHSKMKALNIEINKTNQKMIAISTQVWDQLIARRQSYNNYNTYNNYNNNPDLSSICCTLI